MNTVSLRTVSAIVAAAAFSAIAAAPAKAQTTQAQVRAEVLQAQAAGSLGSVAAQYGYDTAGRPQAVAGTASRAEVRAAAEQAVASGDIDRRDGETYGGRLAAAPADSGLSRADVRASTLRAVTSGEIDAQLGERSQPAFVVPATRSRAAVRAELQRARADGTLAAGEFGSAS